MEDSPVRQFLGELRRRRVYRVAAVYLVVGWILLQLGDIVVQPLGLPEWTMPLLIVLVVLGFPLALVLAWAFDITPDGVQRTEPGSARLASPSTSEPAPTASRRTLAYAGAGGLMLLAVVGWYVAMGGPVSPGTLDAPEAGSTRTVAVLPFENTSPDPENEFFADGVTDDILTHLSRIADFTVPSRTTVMRYKGSPLSLSEIADELGVEYILEGSVRRVDDRVRISTQLVHAFQDEGLWADTYDRDLEDIFAVQTEIARAIADALEARLSPSEEARIVQRPTENLEAYDLFLLGRESYYRYDLEGTEQAIEAFRDALDLDPGFALARAWLGRAYAIYSYNHGVGHVWSDSAVATAREAVEQEADLAAAHSALGVALSTSGRYEEAESVLGRAIELNPNDWAAVANLGVVYGSRGRVDEAIRLARESLQREPVRSALAYGNLGELYLRLDLPDWADQALGRAVALQPDHWTALYAQAQLELLRGRVDLVADLARAIAEGVGNNPRAAIQAASLFLFVGDHERAGEILEETYRTSPTAIPVPYSVGVAYAYALDRAGHGDRAEGVLSDAEAHVRERIEAGDELPNFPYNVALIHFLRDEPDQGLARLEDTVDLGWTLTYHMHLDPILDPVRDEPRYQAVLDRMEERLAPMRERVEREGW